MKNATDQRVTEFEKQHIRFSTNITFVSIEKYYCHDCAVSNGIVHPVDAKEINLTGTSYQCGKFMKHTSPSRTEQGRNSLFIDPTYQKYSEYIITGSISGMVEIDEFGRKNILWYAGKKTGVSYEDGFYIAPDNGVKIVLSENSEKIHAYPINGILELKQKCCICGIDLPGQ